MKRTTKRMGRPPLPENIRRSIRVCVRLNPVEYARLVAEARRTGGTISDVLLRGWRMEG